MTLTIYRDRKDKIDAGSIWCYLADTEMVIKKPYFHSLITIYSKCECKRHNTTQVGGREL